MDPIIAALVIGSALLHPLREVYIKDNAYPEGLAYAVMAQFALLAGIHVVVAGSDPWVALNIWPLVVASGVAVILYYLFTVMCVKLGDVSVYYPIMRSSPLFVVVAGYFVLGHRYPFVLLTGIAIVLVSAFLLQYERGGARVFDNRRALLLGVAAMCTHGVVTLVDAEAMRSVRPEEFFLAMYVLIVLPGMAVVFVVMRPPGRGRSNTCSRGGGQRRGDSSRREPRPIFRTTCCWPPSTWAGTSRQWRRCARSRSRYPCSSVRWCSRSGG